MTRAPAPAPGHERMTGAAPGNWLSSGLVAMMEQ
jgi:hypothetical protein